MLKSRGGEIRAKASDKAKAETINDVLAVADNFERAAAAINPETDGERSVADYYQGLYETMMDCLKELGLEEVEQVGCLNFHEVLAGKRLVPVKQPARDADVLWGSFRTLFPLDTLLCLRRGHMQIDSRPPAFE